MAGSSEPGATATIWTVGHGTRPTADLIALCRAAGISQVVDVRRFPGSRRNPQFTRDRFAAELADAGLTYRWRGDTLGGRRALEAENRHTAWANAAFRAYAGFMEGNTFRVALQELEAEGASGQRLALLCAETLWWRCHRRLIADALLLDGLHVRHLIDRPPGQLHRLHPAVRRGEAGELVYDGPLAGEP